MYIFNKDGIEKVTDFSLIDFNSSSENLVFIRSSRGGIFRLKDLSHALHPGLKIKINGTGNLVYLQEPIYFKESLLHINSSHNIIAFGPTKRLVMLNVCITDGDHQCLRIGKNFSCGRTKILMHEEYVPVTIGEDCMFSADVVMMNSDCRCISTTESNTICSNFARGIKIGNHVWVGRGAAIFKNAGMADGSILGAYSVLAKNFTETNIALAGNPAKIVKTNISWDRMSVTKFIRENFEGLSTERFQVAHRNFETTKENLIQSIMQ